MKDIIERLEKATGPDRELDALVHLASTNSTWVPDPKAPGIVQCPTARGSSFGWSKAPFYTDSLDDAMTLVPEGWRMVGMSECERGGWYASAFPRDPDAMGIPRTFDAHSATLARGEAPTAALALCIAALKAREQLG